MEHTARFNYREMAREAGRECEAIRHRLDQRRAARPLSPEAEIRWKRENSVLYDMYLEQRSNERLFSRRAGQRDKLGREAQ